MTRRPRAGADLDDIWLRVALDNPDAADRLIDRILRRIDDLQDHPRLGPARPDISADARMLIVGDYLVLYSVTGTDVVIVRVVHGARDLGALFDIEPFEP